MGLETGTYVSDLVATNPGATDIKGQGDDHLRLIKTALRNTFPNADAPFYFPRWLAKTASYTVLATDGNTGFAVDATSGAATLTLPDTAGIAAGWEVEVHKVDSSANAVTVVPNSGTLAGEASIILKNQYNAARFMWTGTVWLVTRLERRAFGNIVSKTADATLTRAEMKSLVLVDGAANVTITLPTATGFDGDWVIVKNLDAVFKVTLDGNSTELIEGAATYDLLYKNGVVCIMASGGAWYITALDEGDAPLETELADTMTQTAKSANYTVLTSDQGSLLYLTGSTARTFTLPAIAGVLESDLYYFGNSSTALLTLDGNASETIDGQTTLILGPNQTAILAKRGSGWIVFARPRQTLWVVDRKGVGVDGQALTSGSFVQRVLTDLLVNLIPGASLASNRLTLPAGRYKMNGNLACRNSSSASTGYATKLYDVTNAATLINFLTRNVASSEGGPLPVDCEFNLVAETTLEFQTWVSRATQTAGNSIGSGEVETYASVTIERL